MQYAPITALLVEAVKELKDENESVKVENEELRERLLTLEARQVSIETMLLAGSINFPKEKLVSLD